MECNTAGENYGLELSPEAANYLGQHDPTTARQLIKPVGKTGRYLTNGMYFPVTILDTRTSFGNTQYYISPIGGSGTRWVGAGVIVDGE